MRFRHFLVLLAFVAAAPCAAADSPKAEIEQVVTRFQASLKTHDRAALANLFLADSKAWWNVLGDESYRKVKAKHPEAARYKAGTWQEFADYVGGTKASIEERFHNVRIETDGSVASVYFDFEFVADGKVGNKGAETWQLIRTDDGWKIASMLYSSNF
ncbi:ketosteroid isomerase-like protein [Luteibacter jiangsuensis]|uniref:Ketosteroid isomerase-like protein n=1 Tax=Luteibacter jiangsuensis TaxID=637577 RepID=A0ABT9SX41_9GAMM|nr:nuclear transport factor 2 family protein [Luteibacter jiangsuensis]MDQ0009575.1 ketosteroid isomerase-like protein [Luteibacter jiangsuensis]